MATDDSAEQIYKKDDLRNIAIFQKIVVLGVGIYLLVIVPSAFAPPQIRALLGLAILGVGLLCAICVFLLAIKLYHPVVGVLLALLTVLPCIGLLILLIINGKATGVLRKHGYSVGLFGASLSEFDR